MKKLLALLLLSPLAYAEDETKEISFTLSCKVTGQVLIQTKDGVSTTYSSYKDDLEVGDTFPIKFNYTIYDDDKYRFEINVLDLYVTGIASSDGHAVGYGTGFLWDIGLGWMVRIYEDSLDVDSLVGNMILRRYYKNDYELMHSQLLGSGSPTRTLTANCMNMPSEYEKVLLLIKSKESDKWGK